MGDRDQLVISNHRQLVGSQSVFVQLVAWSLCGKKMKCLS